MPTVDFEQRWAVIEAFIEAEAVNPDPVVVDTLREMVRYGELPVVSGPEMGLPASGPEMGLPASGPGSSGPEMGLPAAGPGGAVALPVTKKLVFKSAKSANEAYVLMEDLAEEMLLEP